MATTNERPTSTRLVATTFRLPADILAGLAHVKARDGTPIAQQVQRALRTWLKLRRATVPTPTTTRRTR